jgi:hypothetical protein
LFGETQFRAAFCNAAELFTQIGNRLPDDYRSPQ